ncbi:hypothetical protein RB2150_10876 [Rhodobacteraceae bacterium HTCC2150]|nr:hypothetical protein RB2150_10876 [Rhodobacteraceae bacterium HTCC2150]
MPGVSYTFGGVIDYAFATAFATTGGHSVTSTENGVTFTLSSSIKEHFYIALNSFGRAYVTNAENLGTQTMNLVWGGPGSSQFLSPLVTGTFEAGEVKFVTASGSVDAVSGVAFSGQVLGINFMLSGMDAAAISKITAVAVNCFCASTRISTSDGMVDVEKLIPGDVIETADGRTSTVKWLGEQPVNTQILDPSKINPICITVGALGDGLPKQDLFISPDHAVAIDGLLINAGALVNGRSIYQVEKMPKAGFTYYHVETDAHELLLAEGVSAETFIDYAGRDSFVNGEDATAHGIKEMPLPRVSSARQVSTHIRDRLNLQTNLVVNKVA